MTRFDATTTLDRHAPGSGSPSESTDATFSIDIDPSWSSLRGVHGGYLAALGVRAVEAISADLGNGRSVRTSTTSFLRPGRVGPTRLVVDTVRESRSLGTYAVNIVQDDRVVSTSRVTTTVDVAGEQWETATSYPLAPVEQCVPVEPPEGVRHFEQATALLDPADIPFAGGELARVAGYVRPLEPRAVDAAWLTMILDWFPPSPFGRTQPPTGGVSIDLTVHIHRTLAAVDEPRWLGADFHADISAGGLALEQGTIRDGDGRVLAQSFHTRWTG